VFDCCRIGQQQIAHRERNLVCTIVLFESSMLAFTWRHRRNFTLKSGSDQWRRQDLVSGGHDDRGAEGASIEAPKAPSGVGYGEGCPLASRGGSPAPIAFSAYFRPQNASGSKKNTILLPKV